MDAITSFSGTNSFLSNFYECPVTIDNITYQNAEAAFQAQKSDDDNVKLQFAEMAPKTAKQKGKKIQMCYDRTTWNEVKYDIMYKVVKQKFLQNEDIRQKLLDTGDAELIEGNRWNDRDWGQCPVGTGKNNLGKILMRIRNELR